MSTNAPTTPRDPEPLLIDCQRLGDDGVGIPRGQALEEALDNDVKQVDDTCLHCPNKCYC